MKTLYSAKVSVESGRDGAIRSDDGRLALRLAFPKVLGGDGEGTNPEQLFAAGYGACFASTMKAIAKSEGTSLDTVEIIADVDMMLDGELFQLGAQLTVRAPGVPREALERLVDKARGACPYSRAIRGNVTTNVILAP